MTDYTKGEWKAIEWRGIPQWEVWDDALHIIASIRTWWNSPHETRANAQLTAAAPEMYEAAKSFVRVLTEVLEDYGRTGLPLSHTDWLTRLSEPDRQARQAIAKAEGKED